MGHKLELICGADGHQTLSRGKSHQCWPIDFRGCGNNRYMDDILLACTSFNELQAIASEAVDLFRSRGFKLRKWVAKILWDIPKSDLAPSLGEVDIGCDPLPDSGTLGLTWDPQQDVFRINCKSFKSAVTRREISSQLVSQFDPLGMASPFLLGGKLLLQQVAISGVDWNDVLPLKVQDDWNGWETLICFVRSPSLAIVLRII